MATTSICAQCTRGASPFTDRNWLAITTALLDDWTCTVGRAELSPGEDSGETRGVQ